MAEPQFEGDRIRGNDECRVDCRCPAFRDLRRRREIVYTDHDCVDALRLQLPLSSYSTFRLAASPVTSAAPFGLPFTTTHWTTTIRSSRDG